MLKRLNLFFYGAAPAGRNRSCGIPVSGLHFFFARLLKRLN
jgi:hypothetical protein